MKHTDDLAILSERPEAYIGICSCCNTLNVVYKNIAIKFKENEFIFFRDYISNLNPEEFIAESKTGKNIFMASPVHNIVFCFAKSEIQELKAMMSEATVMLQVNRIFRK